jgi:hypothetical protein
MIYGYGDGGGGPLVLLPLRQDLSIELGVSGRLPDLSILLNASAHGMHSLSAEARLGVDEVVELKQVSLLVENLNVPLLTGLEETPLLSRFYFTGSGSILIDDPASSDWSGELATSASSWKIPTTLYPQISPILMPS